jgi:hypothetical protein
MTMTIVATYIMLFYIIKKKQKTIVLEKCLSDFIIELSHYWSLYFELSKRIYLSGLPKAN